MSSLYNYLIFVLLLKETCFKRLQESYKYSLKLDRHQGFFFVCFNKRTASNQIHLCIIASRGQKTCATFVTTDDTSLV